MRKKTKKILIIVVVSIMLLNPVSLIYICICIHEIPRWLMLEYKYKDDIYEFVYHSDKDDFWDDSSYECMLRALEGFEEMTNDSVKMDSMLIELLSFRNKNGEIICNDIHKVTVTHIGSTRRYHLMPYIELLRDSFASYPEDKKFCTVRSDGISIINRNIKEDLETVITVLHQEQKEN